MSFIRTFAACSGRIARNQAVSTKLGSGPRSFTSSARRHIFPTQTPSFQSSTPRNVVYVRFGQGPQSPRGPGRRPLLQVRAVRIGAVIGIIAAVYYTTHLEQVPYTGRWRFMNTDAKEEQVIADALHQQILDEYHGKILPPNHPITRHVRRVVSRILVYSKLGVLKSEEHRHIPRFFPFGFGDVDKPASDTDFGASDSPAYGPEKEWNVLVVNDNKMINAMAIPGTVVVFTGILPVCQDEQGLAAVVAHEIGHVVARHTAERMSSSTLSLLLLPIALLTGLDISVLTLGHSLFLNLPNSRAQESEADLIGLRLMSRACYNPRAAPEMFERLGKIEELASRVTVSFLRTHPTSGNRVKFLEAHLSDAFDIMASNPECEDLREQYEAFRHSAKQIRADQTGTWEVV
ncbi:peptidase family M48-domain-containing protein [Cyathus striatus]|nr:peptidase family M48-domain-containing protein [Cyathus striatus]